MRAILVWALIAAGPPTEQSGQGIPKGAKLHVLLIAIDQYGSHREPDLNCSVRSANGLANALARQKGTYGEVLIKKLLNKDATRGAIGRELGALAKSVSPDDRCVIYFSGRAGVEYAKGPDGKKLIIDKKPVPSYHATPVFVSRSGREYARGGNTYSFHCQHGPSKTGDSRFTGNELHDSVRRIRGHVLLLMDTPHSGALTVTRGGGNYAVIATSQDYQDSVEVDTPTETFPYTFFAIPLIKALQEGTEPLTARALFDKVCTGQAAALAAFGIKKGSKHEHYLFSPAALLPGGGTWQIARFPSPK